VRKDDDRDRAIDRLLPQVLGGDPSTPCVDGETLAAWTDGMLRASEAARVEQHVADCGRCQAMLGAFVRVLPAPPPQESLWQRSRLGWVLPLATAAAAVALWVVIPGQGPSGAPESTVTLADARRDTSSPAVTAPPAANLPSPAAPAETAAAEQSRPAAIGPTSEPPAVSVDAARQKAAAPADRGAVADAAAPELRRKVEEPSKPLGALAKDANRERDLREESARPLAETVTLTAQAPRVDTANVGPTQPAPGAMATYPAPVPPSPPAAAAPAAAPAAVAGGAPARPAAQAFERADAADARVAAARKSEVAAVVEISSSVASTRWRIVGGRRLERTTTGGLRWDGVALPDALDLMAGASPSPQVCWVVGRGGRVYLTIDGERFTRVVFPEATDLVGVRAGSARVATVTAADGRTFTTADGGTTWTR
jgi:hypothetical protein